MSRPRAESNRLSRFVLVLALALVMTLGLVGFAVKQSSSATNQLTNLTQTIQRQRFDAVISNCRAQNQRNRSTIHTLDKLLQRARRHASPKMRAQLQASRSGTVLLIDALAPVQNCTRQAERITGIKHPPR